MRILTRLKGALPTTATVGVTISTAPVGPPMAPAEPTLIHHGSPLVPPDLSLTAMVSSQTFWSSFCSQIHGLTDCIQEATTSLVLDGNTFLGMVDRTHIWRAISLIGKAAERGSVSMTTLVNPHSKAKIFTDNHLRGMRPGLVMLVVRWGI